MERTYIIIQMRHTFAHVHIKHLSHLCLSLAFFRNVSSLQRTPVTVSQGQNSVRGINALQQPYLIVLHDCWLQQEHLMNLSHFTLFNTHQQIMIKNFEFCSKFMKIYYMR